jgi:hypothetical protein
MSSADRDVAEAIAGELRLLDPAVRASQALVDALLDPEFVEIGASGRFWTRAEVMAGLSDLPGSQPEGSRYSASDIRGVRLAPGIVHLIFETVDDGHRARRSSIWRKTAGESGWRMYYHQGTLVPG